ncbi:non structural virulence protein [Finch poxvirus]|nr:non structural virulence protein [Finch poxvirus]
MLSTKVFKLDRKYSTNKFLDTDKLRKERFIFDKFLSKFGRLLDIKLLTKSSGEKVSFFVDKFCLVIVVLEVPYINDKADINVNTLNTLDCYYRVNVNSYIVVKNTLASYRIDITCISGEHIDTRREYLRTYKNNSFTVLTCLFDREYINKPITQCKKYLLIGNYIREWIIFKKNVKIVDDNLERITSRKVTSHYYINENNHRVIRDTSIGCSDIVVSVKLSKITNSDVRKDKYLMQALRWPLGNPTLIFFKLWFSTEYYRCKMTMNSIVSILKSITRKNVTSNYGLGDLLLSSFGIVRKQANKLGINCSRISFRNLWKDIVLIQMKRYYKLKKRSRLSTFNIVPVTDIIDYQYLPTNPWMVDITKEVELWNDLLMNILDKEKWSYDWPALSR